MVVAGGFLSLVVTSFPSTRGYRSQALPLSVRSWAINKNQDDTKEEFKKIRAEIDDKLKIQVQNPFFEDLYYMLNSIISPEGIRFSEFK